MKNSETSSGNSEGHVEYNKRRIYSIDTRYYRLARLVVGRMSVGGVLGIVAGEEDGRREHESGETTECLNIPARVGIPTNAPI